MTDFCVDIREPQRTIDAVRDAFEGEDVEVKVQMYSVADFFWKNKLGIERKSPSDYVASIKDERLFQQAEELKQNFTHPIILVSGTLKNCLQRSRGMNKNSIIGATSSLLTRRGVPALFTGTEFAQCVLRLYKKASKGGPVEYTPVRRSASKQDKQRHVLKSLPNIGDKKAERILDEYDSPLAALRNLDDWKHDIDGVSDGTTNNIKQVLEAAHGEI